MSSHFYVVGGQQCDSPTSEVVDCAVIDYCKVVPIVIHSIVRDITIFVIFEARPPYKYCHCVQLLLKSSNCLWFSTVNKHYCLIGIHTISLQIVLEHLDAI